MTRDKKVLICFVVPLAVIVLCVMTTRRAGHAARMTPAAVAGVADPFQSGKDAMDAGDYPVALAYFLQVPRNDRNYSTARRFIGWELYTERMNRPAAGFSYVHEAILSDPTSGNVWQDASRVYGHALKSLFVGQ